MEQLFLDIQNKLKDITGIKYIGEDWGQLGIPQPPVNFPCVLLDLGSETYSSLSGGAQQVEAQINITVADARFNGITPTLPELQTQQAFAIFKLLKEINKALHGKGGESYSRLCRQSTKKILRDDAIREFVVTYKTSYKDTAAQVILTSIHANPSIEIGNKS